MTDVTPGRWSRLTPGRLMVALAALEGGLWLSGRFSWLPKGWPVLVAGASVAAFLVVMALWLVAALLFRWRFQFGMRWLVALTVLVAGACSWLVVEMEKAKKQEELVAGIRKLRGFVRLGPGGSQQGPQGPARLRRLLGDCFFNDVTDVDLNDDRQTAWLRRLPDLSHVRLYFSRGVTNGGMKNLDGLAGLGSLEISSDAIDDDGLRHLRGLTGLQSLSFSAAGLTDAGLEHLETLHRLRALYLAGTKVTDRGLARLQCWPQLANLSLYGTKVTDEGLVHLKWLARLESLDLSQTRVTDAGLKHLRVLSNLRELGIADTFITGDGLEELQAFPRLERLRLSVGALSKASVRHLKAAKQLRRLSFGGREPFEDEHFALLQELSQLEELELNNHNLSAEAQQRFEKAVPKCKVNVMVGWM